MTISGEKLDRLIRQNVITNEDLSFILLLSNYEFLQMYGNTKSYKNDVLNSIFIDPKQIYDSKLIDEDITSKLIDFVIRRYNDELYEVKTRMLDGEMSEIEFEEYKLKLENYFFPETNEVGKNIKRIAQVRENDSSKKIVKK